MSAATTKDPPGVRARRSRGRRAAPAEASNVVRLHQRIMPRHVELLARWLAAGRLMGLCDATTFTAAPLPGSASRRVPSEYVLIWVRENVDPAYLIRPLRVGWVVIDSVREIEIGHTSSFAAALQLIRPVLKVSEAA